MSDDNVSKTDDVVKGLSPNSDDQLRDMISKLPAPPAVRISNVEGHAGQFVLNGIYIRSLTETHNGAPIFEFCGDDAFGYDDIILYFDDKQRWRVASKNAHLKAGTNLCYLMGEKLGKKAPVGSYNSWSIYDGKKWGIAKLIKSVRVFDVDDILDAMKYKENMKLEKARIMNSYCGFEIKGMVGSAGQKCLNGVYREISGMTHQGKPVYEFLNDGKPCFAENYTDIVMHFDDAGRWRIDSMNAHMLNGGKLCYVLGNGSCTVPPVGKNVEWMTYESKRWTIQRNVTVTGLDKTGIENRLAEIRMKNSQPLPDPSSKFQIECVELSNIRGHSGQTSLNGMYVRMKNVEKNGHDVFEFTGGHAYGHSDLVMFLDTENRWRVASRSVHMEGPSNLCYLMCKGCIHGAPLEGVWSVYDGKAWVPNLSIKTENITDPERVAGALKRKTQMQRRYSHARKATKGIRFEHIQGTAGQSCLNGDYVIVDGVTRNNRSVYRFTGPEVFGHKCIYLYFDTNGRWRVAAKDTFDGRSSTAYIMGVGFTGMTPVGDGEWQIYMNKKWTTLPEITTKPLNDAQALRTLMDEKERLKNNISVDDIKGLRLAGLTGKAKQECLNGVYNIVKDMKINDHPVFMFKEKAYDHDDLMMFLDESGRWRIASKSEHYDKGTDICYTMGVGFLGALPFTGDDNPGTWETYNDGAWKPCDQAMTIPIMKRSSPVHRSKKSFFETKSMDESLPGISLKPQDSRGYRKGNPGKNSDGIGRFPNFGMSLKFLRQIRNDPRLLQPMYSLPYVTSGKYPYGAKYGTLVEPLTLKQLQSLDLKALRMLSLECRVFSEMDGNDEFLRYSDSSPIKDTKSYIDALCKVPTTTTHVNIFIVKPDTLSAECCYAKKILKEDPQHAHELVGTPTLFLSHAWRYTFKTLMSALDTHFEDKSDSEKLACRVWNDIFVEDQNNVDSKPKDYFFTAFLNAVGSIGNTLLVLDPWNAPIPFERSWCVWEIYSTIATNGKLHVSLSPDGRKEFWKNFVTNFQIIVNVVSTIDAQQASAFSLDDKKRIDQTIRDSVGFLTVNKLISDEMLAWLANSGKALLRSENAEGMMTRQERAVLITCLASLLQDQGKLEEAESYLRKGLSGFEQCCGTDSPETLEAVVKLGELLEKREKVQESVQLYRREAQGVEDALGEDHVDCLFSKNRLARALVKLGGIKNKDEAETLMRKTLEVCSKKYDSKHPRYESSLDDLIELLTHRRKFSEAENFCRESLKLKRARSKNSRETISIFSRLGNILFEAGKTHAALDAVEDCLRIKQDRFGDNHEETLASATFLAKIHRKLGDDTEAVKRIRTTLKARMNACRTKLERCTARFESFIEDNAYEGRLITQFEKFEASVKALQGHIESTEGSLKF